MTNIVPLMRAAMRLVGSEHSAAKHLYGRLKVFVIAVVTVVMALPVAVSARERDTVRVGYYENEVFQEGARKDAVKTGYAYEYYQKLVEYTGWKYEYVYGTYGELYQKLLDGKIDLLAGLVWKKERQGLIGYPEAPMGSESFNLVKHSRDDSITADPKTLNGKTIGVLDSALLDVLKRYLARNRVVADVRTYKDYPPLFAAFDSGKLDVLVAEANGAYGRSNTEVLAPFGGSSYFVCVNIRRPDLLAKLNRAQAALAVEDPTFLPGLNMKYFPKTILARAISRVERQWLQTHHVLRVGFLENYMPYCGKDSRGQVTGVVKDIIPELLARLGLSSLKVTYSGYKSYDAMTADVAAGRIDVAFPVGGGLYFSEQTGLHQSVPVTSMASEQVYRGDYTEKTGTHFAVNKNNRMQYYFVRRNFPNAKVTQYPTIEACLDAVLSGKATCTILNGLRAHDILKNRRYTSLSLRHLGINDDRCFGVRLADNGLLKLLNRGLGVIERDFVQKKSHRYTHLLYSYRLRDAFFDHPWIFASLFFAVAAVIIGLLSRDIRRTRRWMAEKTAVLTDLENASGLARLASFHYDFNTRERTGSNLVRELWPEDANGHALREEQWVHPEDIPVFKQNINALREKKSDAAQFSFRGGFSSDDCRYYRMKLSLDPNNPDAVTGIVQDVTEITVSMLKLKNTQELWNNAINSVPIMFTVKDIDDGFRYLLCNRAFSETFNFLPGEVIGKTDREIFHDDATLGFTDRINTPSTGSDGITEIEGELPDGSGNLRYIKTLMRVFEDARGHRLLLAAGSDITEKHKLFQNQRVINKLLEDILGEDDSERSVRRTLEAVCKILGASRSCLIRHEEEGTKAHCVFEYAEPTHPYASFRMLGRTLSRVRGILENTDDKRTFICSDIGSIDWSGIEDWHQAALALNLRAIFLSNIVSEGKVKGTVAFNFEGIDHTFTDNDISLLRATTRIIEVIIARKHAQDLIMDALAHAQAADKAKSFFIASVSHEIRTPLNSVIGFAELLREGGVTGTQEKEYLDAIFSSANALLMLINDVLDLSKLEANQMKIVTDFTDFNALCREVMLIFTFRARENGNKLVPEVPEDLPELDIDNIRIRQILINLFGNAVKFTKNGTITLHVTFTPDPVGETGTLRCAVSDTGIGISEENQKKLMEPFVQLSGLRGTNAVNNGTGLGLSISKRLAVRMNGELTCASRIGEGSTFTVTLNAVRYRAKVLSAAKEQPKSGPGAEAPARAAKPVRILVVDDVPLNLHVAKALFNRIGFDEIYTAGSGSAALELLEKQPVDLILSDMWMPGMNGAEFSAAVKKDPRFAHIPVVAQTADVETNGNFDMSHFDAIILKPLTREKLSGMVKRVVVEGDLRKGDGGTSVNLG